MNYEITVKGTLDQAWSDWFSNVVITVDEDRDGRASTILSVRVDDQAALRGMLNKLWDLNLTLLSVTCCEFSEGDDDGKR
jgi:hypothetical protein